LLVFSIILESINPLIFSKLELKLSFNEIKVLNFENIEILKDV